MPSATEIVFDNGAQRIIPPAQTLERVLPLAPSMGITRVANVTGLDKVGIPVVMVCRPNARSVSVSQGKGSTVAAAKASGLMESIEGYHAEHITLPMQLDSFNLLSRRASVVSPDDLPALDGSRFDPHLSLPWIEAGDLLAGSKCWVPLEMVHTNYTLPRIAGSGCFTASSNGLASGNSILEATVHGICEVIERDALSLWHRRNGSDLDRTSLDPDSIHSELCRETMSRLDAAGLDYYLWDITSDTGIPTCLCALFDQKPRQGHIGIGSGTHLSREVAMLRAIHEAVQVRTTYIVGARDDITVEEYSAGGMEAKQDYFQHKVSQCSFIRSYGQTASREPGFLDRDLETLLESLQAVGIKQALRVNLTRPEFNIPVVRIILPGMEAPHDDTGYLPGPRARAIGGER